MNNGSTVGPTIAAWSIGAVFFLIAWWVSRRRMRVADTPRSRCAAVFVGFNHVEGAVGSLQASAAHFTEEVAAWWRATLEHEWEVTVVVTSRDSDGNEHRELRTHYEFRLSDRWGSADWFSITDETGTVRVNAEKATVNAPMRFDHLGGFRLPGIGFVTGPGARPTGLYREREYRLHDGDHVFCLGFASIDPTGANLVIDGKGGEEFLVTVTPPEKVARNRRVGTWVLGLIGAAIPVASAGSVGWGVVRGLILAGLLTLWNTAMVWNRLIRVKELQQRAWSLIDVQLERRATLIPQLVECARGYAAHEATTLQQIAAARSNVLGQWTALAERYPNLGADVTFRKVFDEVRDTETRISSSREYFNDTVKLVRDRTSTFPGVLLMPFAKDHRFGAMEPIAAGDEERVAPNLRALLGNSSAPTSP